MEDELRETRAMLERLTQTADKYIFGHGGEPLTGQVKEDMRRMLAARIDEAWDLLRRPKASRYTNVPDASSGVSTMPSR